MPTVFRPKKTSQWWHRDATVSEIKVPKGGHLKTDPVEKECNILHKSSYICGCGSQSLIIERSEFWSDPTLAAPDTPLQLCFLRPTLPQLPALRSLSLPHRHLSELHVFQGSLERSDEWQGKSENPIKSGWLKKKVSLVFSCRLCLKKTTRSVNLSLPAIFRHKVLKGLYQRTGTPVGGDGHARYCHFSWWLTHGIRLYMHTIPDFCTDPDVVSSVLGNTLTLCNKTVISNMFQSLTVFPINVCSTRENDRKNPPVCTMF